MHSLDQISDGDRIGRNLDAPQQVKRPATAFGSPGSDHTIKRIDLNEALIQHAEATYTMRFAGGNMHEFGIDDGDVLLVDRAISAVKGKIVIAMVEGEFVCRRLSIAATDVRLTADSGTTDIAITESTPLEVWGVVTTVIKRLP
jgi:DNA polymerase V